MSARLFLLCAALFASSVGCAGARSYVVAREALVPISMSDGLRGEDGKLLADGQKHVVGEFSYDYRAWGMLWTAISFTGNKDISDAVNEQVKDAGGDAINNLEVRSGNCGWTLFTAVGLLPSCSNVEIRGDIVKVSSLSAPATVQVSSGASK
jgi:hypothetical protein